MELKIKFIWQTRLFYNVVYERGEDCYSYYGLLNGPPTYQVTQAVKQNGADFFLRPDGKKKGN